MTLDPRPVDAESDGAQQAASPYRREPTETETAQLVVEVDGRVERVLVLSQPVITIGRTPGNALPLQHEAVSRQHAELRLTQEGVILTDLGSKNGTVVGAARLAPNQPVRLLPGSVFRIGPFLLRYEVAHSGAVEALAEGRSAASGAAEDPTTARLLAAYSPSPPPRETALMPLPNNGASNYLDFLPMIFHENDFFSRFLLIFQSVWEPLEQRQDHIAMYFDSRTSPAPFLPWLAGWLGVSAATRLPEGRLRTLLGEAVELYRWRGTRYGLTRMIEVCTGVTPVIAESQSNPAVLYVRISVPKDDDVDRDTIERLIVANKPAHTAYVLEMSGPD